MPKILLKVTFIQWKIKLKIKRN